MDQKMFWNVKNITCLTKRFLSQHACVENNISLKTGQNILNAGDISININIFQGDSLSTILFCVSLITLNKLLNNRGYGYEIYDNTTNHVFYMDNLKLFAKNDQELHVLSNIVKQFSDDIRILD